MMDTEGSEVHIMTLDQPIKAEAGAEFVFTIREPASCSGNNIAVSYDAFAEDVQARGGGQRRGAAQRSARARCWLRRTGPRPAAASTSLMCVLCWWAAGRRPGCD
jgi:hypothetical protein